MEAKKSLIERVSELEREIEEQKKSLEETNAEIIDSRVLKDGLSSSAQDFDRIEADIEQAIKEQRKIKEEYSSRLNAVKIDFEEAQQKISESQYQYDLLGQELDQELGVVARQQRELYCLMLVTKNLSLDHLKLYRQVQLLKKKEVKDLIQKKFFPQIEEEQNKREEGEKNFLEEYSEVNLKSIKMIMQRVKEQLEF